MQQQFYNDLGLYQLCLVLQKLVEFKDFSRLLSDFPVFFKADLIFQDFSRKQTLQIREQTTKFVTGGKRVNILMHHIFQFSCHIKHLPFIIGANI